MAYQYLLPQVPYYGPTAYTYLPTMNVNAAFPGMSSMQCMDSCCSIYSAPVTSAFLSSGSCTDSCCSPSPNIVINNATPSCCTGSCCSDAPNVIINNPSGNLCMDNCCSPAQMYGMPQLYEDTCNTTSSYYYSNKPSVRHKKDDKGVYTSYGSACMIM